LNFINGIIIGAAGIIPGISGAVIAMIFGIYDKLLYSINNFFKDIKSNTIFLFPILSGIAVGFVIFSNVQKTFILHFPNETMLFITGLIAGTVPLLISDAKFAKFKLSYMLVFLLTLGLGIFMASINDNEINVSNEIIELNFKNIITLMIIGFIMAGSHIIPGISGTVILVMMGFYGIMLNSIANLKNILFIFSPDRNFSEVITNIITLLPMGIGLIIGVLFFSWLMNLLLKKYHTLTYCAVLGFVIGSIPSIMPPHINFWGICFLGLGFFISYNIKNIS